MALRIRPYQPGDRAGLERCIAEMQESERAIDPRLRPGAEVAPAYCEHLFVRGAANTGVILIAENAGQVVGFVAVQARVPFEELDEPPGSYALVSDLAVMPLHRRSGIGRALLSAAEAHARTHRAREIRIGVLAGNLPARALYQTLGFRPHQELLTKGLPPEP